MARTEEKKKEGYFLKSKVRRITTVIIAVYLGISAASLSYTRVFFRADEALTNALYKYNPLERGDKRITIITIDEETKALYGDNNEWSREKYADLVDILSADGAAVIGLDVNLSGEKDKAGDDALVTACEKAGNVVVPMNASFRQFDVENDQEELKRDEEFEGMEVSLESGSSEFKTPAPVAPDEIMGQMEVHIEYPYADLCDVVSMGVVNALQQSVDGTIRNAALSVRYIGEEYDAFAVSVYKIFQEANGEEFKLPKLDEEGMFGFNALWNTESYQKISYSQLISGSYDPELIAGKMVLVGEYDPISYSNPKDFFDARFLYQEVMVDASILQALIRDKVVVEVEPLFQALFYGITITIFYILFSSRKRLLAFVGQLCWGISVFAIAFTLNMQGYRFMLLIPLVFTVVSVIIFLIQHMIMQYVERKRMEATLKMYVDSKVVDQIEDVSPFALKTVSERKNIAVLFVDIRGFTTMSEQLEPEQVVTVLNEYFTLVYASIQAWNGTLDKFIGDAAMAIFNAPKDEEDYIFHAVCAADDIQKGFVSITEKYQKLYGKEIHVGIGINAGEAIVGNIGCLRRMDYTAIGDTVNTASRLESNAASNQILVSETVKRAIEERAKVEFVGALSLKGKSQNVDAYSIEEIDKPKPPNMRARKEFINEVRLLYSKVESNIQLPEFLKKI